MRWLSDWFNPAAPRPLRVVRATLLLLLAATSALRVWLVFYYNPMSSLWSDPGRHWFAGTHPLESGPMILMDPIAYQIYIGILAKLTVGSPMLIAYWTALLSLSGPWLWYRFLREILPRDWALAGWVLLSALPSWSAIYTLFMQETLMLPLLGSALWMTWRCRRKRNLTSFLVATGTWMLAGLTRGICIPLAAVAMLWLWALQDDKLRKAVFSIALLLALLGPLAGRSWSLARVISPHGMGSMVHLYNRAGTSSYTVEFKRNDGKYVWNYVFKSPALISFPLEPFSYWRSARQGNAHFSIDLDQGSQSWAHAADSLPPWTLDRFLWLTEDNLINLFFGQSWPDSNPESLIGQANFWSRFLWVPLTILCVYFTWRHRRQQRDWLLPALLLTWFLVQGVFPLAVNEGRYRKPFEGLLVAQCLLVAAHSRRPLRAPQAEYRTGHG